MQNASLYQISVRTLNDAELLASTKRFVQKERAITTEVLRHLAEIERRKLYCDVSAGGGLKYGSLFEYAVRELGYSEAAAGRRIQAMRLVKEIPEVEQKIESGALSLSNITQAANFFREVKRAEPAAALSGEQKREVLAQLEKKSAREGERVLLAISPAAALPRERERAVSLEHTEVRFLVNAKLKAELEKVRSLLGPKGARFNMAELMLEMARLSVEKLKEKKFGKRCIQSEEVAFATPPRAEANAAICASTKARHSDVGEALRHSPVSRSVPRAVKHAVWQQGGGKCACCGSKQNLQFDHVRPVALGGESTPDNLQLLCSSCNLRRGVKTFGAAAMKRM